LEKGILMSALFESGFCVRQPAWHGLATVVDEYPGSWEAARQLAGLAWDPVCEPIYVRTSADGTEPSYEALDGWRRIARSDTGATLSVMRDSYALIDHQAMGEIVEAIMEQPGARFETAGSLDGGRLVWALAYLDEPIKIPGDHSLSYPFLALCNRHDGTAACKVLPTTVRIVCANTYSAATALGERDGVAFAFRHVGSWRERVDEARDVVLGVRKDHREWIELAKTLIELKISPAGRDRFLAEFVPMPPAGLISDQVARNVEQARAAIRGALYSPTTAPVADTAYGLVQAAGEYLDHLRRYRNRGSHLGRCLLRPEPAKAKAVALAQAVANT
jgi:phage/plasmid-like protein (TIGR03299 family)